MASLQNLGHQTNLSVLGPCEPDEVYAEYIEKCGELDDVSPTLIVWHHFDLKRFVRKGVLNIGFPVFETNFFSPEEVENLNSVDILLTTSNWYLEILAKYVREDLPIHVTPLGVDREIFKEGDTPLKPPEIVKFLNIGKWEIRKSHQELIKAFGEVFSDYDDVSLTLACDNPFIGSDNQKWIDFAHKFIPERQLNILPLRFNSCTDVAKLIQSHDIGVFPSKSEGWNMPLAEHLSSNKLCIATHYSAHTEFAKPDNCLLIAIDEEERMFDGQFFVGNGGTWAKLGTRQIDQLKNYMEKAYLLIKSGDFREKLGFRSSDLLEGFTWEITALKIINIIKEKENV